MACLCNFASSCSSQTSSSFSSLFACRAFPMKFAASFPSRVMASIQSSIKFASSSSSVSAIGTFTWDDVLGIPPPQPGAATVDDSSYLHGYFEKIQLCNRGSEKQSEFLPFLIEEQIVGFIHNGFADHLRSFRDVFIFPKDKFYGDHFDDYVSLHPTLETPEERTSAVGNVVKSLGEEWIPGIRNELYPVTSSFGAPIFFSLERAAAPYFGIKVHKVTTRVSPCHMFSFDSLGKIESCSFVNQVTQSLMEFNFQAYGVHMNGYVERDGQKQLWIGKRSQVKPTYPGMLDHLVAGGLPHGIDCQENLVKECEEEAGIPRSISIKTIPVGAVSYMDIDGYRYKRDVLFCYDLNLPESFVPKNEDGEVDSFKLIPVMQVAEVIRKTQFFKPNCSLVIIDFLFRHGYISPESFGYLDLLRSLRIADFS